MSCAVLIGDRMAWSCCCCRIAEGVASREEDVGGKGVVAARRACCCGWFSVDHARPKWCRASAMAWLACACCCKAVRERGAVADMGGRAAASVRGRGERGVAGNGRGRLRPGPEAAELPAMGPMCGCRPGCAGAGSEPVPVGVRLPAAEGLGDVPGAAEVAGSEGVDGGRRRGSMGRSLTKRNEHADEWREGSKSSRQACWFCRNKEQKLIERV